MMREKTFLCLALVSGMLLSRPAWARSPENSWRGADNVVELVNDDGQRVTLDLRNVTVKQLFDAIHQQTGMDFMYNTEQLASVPPVTVKATNEPVPSVLARVFGETDIVFKIDGKMVTVAKKGVVKAGTQARKLRGTVLDKDNFPVIGAAVMIKGTHRGVATDVDGNYEIEVEPGEVLTFSYIGMEPKEVVYNGMAKLTVELRESSQTTLKDVVVTGIFRKAKESYTGAVSTVTKEQLDMFKGQNLLHTLKNIDASLNFAVDNLNGSNPNNLPSISIRGNASIPTDLKEFNESQKSMVNTPLIIMDGFEISLTKLMDYNDEEIESINILKDAAATAIYGSRGANGVIVVVTKEPEAGKLRANAEMGLTFEIPDLTSYDLLNAAQKLELENSLGLYHDDYPPSDTNWQEVYNRRLRDVLRGVDTDWISKPLHTGVGQRYNLRLEGGSEEFRWAASATYGNTQGAMKDSERRNFTGDITLMYRVKDFIFKNYTSIGVNRSRESKYGSFSDYVSMNPYESPVDENGDWIRSYRHREYYQAYAGNPLYDASLNSFDKSGYEEVTNNFSIEWKPLPEFTVRGQLGLTNVRNTRDVFVSPYNSRFDGDEYASDEGYFRKGTYDYNTGKDFSMNANLTFSYSKVFKDVHQLYVGVDLSASEGKSNMYIFNLEGFGTENITSLVNAQQYAKNSKPSGSQSIYRRFGLTGNASYTYDNRYYVDVSYRVDGNSNFGSNKKYAPFYSVGLGWNLHNEGFLRENSVINTLRLKASYGETGTQLTSSAGTLSVYDYITDNKYLNWGGALLQGLGNPDLTWQKTDEFNLGIEWGLWNDRLKGSFDVYTKKTSNLLSYMDLPLSMGFSSYSANVGAVKNVGFEASLSAYLIRDRVHDLSWMLSGQLVYNKNEITELSADIEAQNKAYLEQDVEIANLLTVGRPQNAIYGVRSLGIDPSTGEEIFLDKDGNVTNTWKSSDMVYLGCKDPKYKGILSSMVRWKGFSLNLSFAYRWGGQVYNSTLRDRVEVRRSAILDQNVDKRVWSERWMKPGDVTFFKGFSDNDTKSTSRYVMDERVLELQSVSLQYKWDNDALRKALPVQTVTFGVNMSDIFYFSSVKLERGINYPFARNVQASVKFLF